MKPATLYSQKNCQPCKAVERRLIKNGTPYVKVDVSEDADAAARLKALGFTSAPVLESGSTVIAGYSPDKIDALSKPVEQPVKELKRDAVVQDRDVVEDKG